MWEFQLFLASGLLGAAHPPHHSEALGKSPLTPTWPRSMAGVCVCTSLGFPLQAG